MHKLFKTIIMIIGFNSTVGAVNLTWVPIMMGDIWFNEKNGCLKTSSHFNIKETSFDYNHHEQALKNLKTCTTYHYRVISEDAQGNKYLSNDYMFTTLPKNHPKKYQY